MVNRLVDNGFLLLGNSSSDDSDMSGIFCNTDFPAVFQATVSGDDTHAKATMLAWLARGIAYGQEKLEVLQTLRDAALAHEHSELLGNLELPSLPLPPPCNYHDDTDAAPFPGKPGYHHLEWKHKVGGEHLRNSRTYCYFAAARAGCVGCLHDALESGISVNAKSANAGYTALAFAIHEDHKNAVGFLHEKGASVSHIPVVSAEDF